MPFAFGDDGSSFDWGSLVNTVVGAAGQVTAAAIKPSTTSATPLPYGYSYPQLQTQAQPSMLGGLTNNNLVLLGIAGVLGFVLFKKVSARRAGGRR